MQTSPILMHEDTINFHGWEKKKVSYVVLVSTCDKTVFLFGLVIRLRQKYGTPCPNLALLSISDLDILGQESRNISDVPMFWVVSFHQTTVTGTISHTLLLLIHSHASRHEKEYQTQPAVLMIFRFWSSDSKVIQLSYGGFLKKRVPLNHPILVYFSGIFHYKPSILGTSIYGPPPFSWSSNILFIRWCCEVCLASRPP